MAFTRGLNVGRAGWPLGLVMALVAAGAAVAQSPALAQAGTGRVTGRVVWGNCLPYPLTAVPGAGAAGGAPAQPLPDMVPQPDVPVQPGGQVQPDGQVAPGRPGPAPGRLLPAGAVLVAVQGTALSARTDEAGRFTLDGVPAGPYLTVAAGPVAGVSAASAWRPNVSVAAGQTVDVGILPLGSGLAIPCRYAPLPGGVPPDSGPASPGTDTSPPTDTAAP
jgi:Carboxypeptidase regulatory-like domain